MQVEFDGSRVDCAELVQAVDASEIEDHKITIVGPDVDGMELEARTALHMLLRLPERTCSLTLSQLLSVSSTTTLTVSKAFTIQDSVICSVSVLEKKLSMQASV